MAPSLKGGGVVETVVCPPERYISVSVDSIKQSLQDALGPGHASTFNQLTKLIEAASQFEFLEVRKRLKHDFRPYSAAATKQSLHMRRGIKPPTEEELDQRELRFVEDFDKLMAAAHYKPLSKDEWDTADREEFTFTMPVEVNWKKHDTQLLARFWAQRPAEMDHVAAIADRILVYHRGISTAKAPGLYINEKVDLLVQYLVVWPVTRVAGRLFDKLGVPDVLTKVEDGEGRGGSTVSLGMPEEDMQHKNCKVAYRRTLAMLMPNTKAVFQHLFKTLELCEPQFNHVVILYREAVTEKKEGDAAAAKAADMASSPAGKQAAADFNKRLARRNIHIKKFQEIPLADTDMVMPEKNLYLKPVVIIQLLITIIGGIVAAMGTIWGTKVDWSIAATALGILVARAGQVYTSAQLQLQTIREALTQGLYEKTRDAQEGVMYVLLDEMADQHVKEVMLAYFTLLQSEAGLTEQQLDLRCENYLESHFDLKVDFAIHDVLTHLLKDGLIRKDDQGLLTAIPLEDALRIMNDQWDDYFTLEGTGGPGHNNAEGASRPKGAATSVMNQHIQAVPGKVAGNGSPGGPVDLTTSSSTSSTPSRNGKKMSLAKRLFGHSKDL